MQSYFEKSRDSIIYITDLTIFYFSYQNYLNLNF